MDAKDFMPDEAAIASIKHDLVLYEADRAAAHRQVMWRVPVFLGLLVIAVVVIAWLFNDLADPNEQWSSTPHVMLYFGGLALALFLYSAAMRPATRLSQNFRTYLLPIVFGFIKDLHYANGVVPSSFERLPGDAIGSYNRQTFDDVISGSYSGFFFELYEASFTQKARRSETTTFKGIVMAFQSLEPFPGLLIATRKSNQVVSFFKGFFGGANPEEIESGHAELDKLYDFRTDNPDAARPLLGGRLAQALYWLGGQWPDEPARIALHHDDCFLLLPVGRNFFELPAISVPLDYQAHVAPMIADMAQLLATASLVRKISDDEGTAE